MAFGADKCAYLHIDNGKIVESKQVIEINGLKIAPLATDDQYKYLGIDENISYVGPRNKERIPKYFERVKKIWSSELSECVKKAV